MYATHKIKATGVTLTIGFLLATAFAAPALAGSGSPKSLTPQQQQAVWARADATNRFYHLGAYSSTGTQAIRARAAAMNRFYHVGPYTSTARQAVIARALAMDRFYNVGASSVVSEQQAVRARADATNRVYHLGAYASASPVVKQADLRRSQATNRFYHAGSYAVTSTSNGSVWTDVGIGAGILVGLILVAGGLAVATRRRTVNEPTTT